VKNINIKNNIINMPTGYVKKQAKKYHVSVAKAEGEWSDAKSAAKKSYSQDDPVMWPTTMNIFKNKMKAHYGKKRKSKKNENMICKFDEFVNEKYLGTKIIVNFEGETDKGEKIKDSVKITCYSSVKSEVEKKVKSEMLKKKGKNLKTVKIIEME